MADAAGNHFGPLDVIASPDAEDYTESTYYRFNKRSGVVSGGAVTFDGRTVTMAPVEAYVAGGFFYRDAAWSDSSPATTGANPRRDLLVLRSTLTTGSGSSAVPGKTVPLILKGDPASSPVDPTPGPRDEWIASWQVPGGGGSTLSAGRDLRRFTDRELQKVATGAVAVQQLVNPGGTYAWNGPQGRRSPYIGAYMRAEVSFLARFLAGSQQQTIAVNLGVTGGTVAENDHDMTERIPGGSGSGEDVRAIKRTAFFICTDSTFGVGYNVVLGTGGSSAYIQNPRTFITGPYQLI